MHCPVHPIPDYDTRWEESPEPTPEEIAEGEAEEAAAHAAGSCDQLCGICADEYERSRFATEAEYLADREAQEAYYEADLAAWLATCTCRTARLGQKVGA